MRLLRFVLTGSVANFWFFLKSLKAVLNEAAGHIGPTRISVDIAIVTHNSFAPGREFRRIRINRFGLQHLATDWVHELILFPVHVHK
jgi:hypothetical protein